MSSPFTGTLTILEVSPGERWRLVEPLRYEVDYYGSGRAIEVPAGFETDGASIPAALRTVLAVWGTYGRAAVIHDYLYWRLVSDPHPEAPTRADADRIFYEAMGPLGTGPVLRGLIYAAVRLFGRSAKPRSTAPANPATG